MTSNFSSNFLSGTRGNLSASILIIGDCYGYSEARVNQPFAGESGQDLSRLLAESQIPENLCFFTNIINSQPPQNDMRKFFFSNKEVKEKKLTPFNGLYPRPEILSGLSKLKELINTLQPKLIIGFGNYVLWALTEGNYSITNSDGVKAPTGISQWRGSQLYISPNLCNKTIPFLPTYHPADALRTYPWRYMIKHDLTVRANKILRNEPWDEPPVEFTVRPSFERTTQFLSQTLHHLSTSPSPVRICIDTETRDGHIACCGFALSASSAFCIPFMQTGSSFPSYWSPDEEKQIISFIRQILLHPNCLLEGQNLLYDVQYFASDWFCLPKISNDTMIAHHISFPGGGDPKSGKSQALGIQQKSLYNIASLYCKHYTYWKDEGKDWESWMGEEQLWAYNCRDCIKTFESMTELKNLIKNFNLENQYLNQLRIANEMLLPMMIRGINRNASTQKSHAFLLQCALYDFDNHLENVLSPETKELVDSCVKSKTASPWYASTTKLSYLFYELLGIKPVLDPKSKNPTTSKTALPTIAIREPLVKPIVEKIELRRSVGVYYSTFIEMESDSDGRLRSSYKLTGTDTFRLASSENAFGGGGNLQNIPSGKETSIEINFQFPNVREQFEPDIGYELAEFDLSGADAQTVAWEADDDDLKSAFRAGLKLHLKNARDVYPEKTRNMTDKDITEGQAHEGGIYSNVKKLAHGTNFGGTAKGLAERIRISIRDAEEFQERWFHLHPGIRKWHIRTEQTLQGIRCWKCTETINGEPICSHCNAFPQGRIIGNKFGYRIIYFNRVHELFNEALAWTPQSTTAINCNLGALALLDQIPWVQILMQVHDSLIVQYPIRYSDRIGDIKKALHSIVVPYPDPLTIPWEAKVSRKNWGSCEKIKW